MAKINYDYCEEKVLYDSGDVENKLLNIYKKGKLPDEANNEFFYTVTPIRENIINWYPFKKDASILEVGGGLGAITGHLCSVAKKVVSVEYSKRRAENIYYRHKNKDNLEVIVGNLNKINFSEKFDYIVLIGVFEYAKRFSDSINPFNDFLNKLKALLKPDGVILIAIENRYGIKYFAGSNEDHFGEKYLSLKGYDDKDIVTFGKEELSNIINDCNFKYHKYYYPFPDYKMPYVIFTDERVPLDTEIPNLLLYNHSQNIFDYDYRQVLPGIIKNKQYGFFANSFLVEISNDKKSLSDVKYARTSYNRTEKYQVYTILKNDNYYKFAKYPEALPHLDNILEINKKLKDYGLNVPKMSKKNNIYKIENIEGITLIEYIKELTDKNDKDAIIKEISNYYALLKKISINREIKKFVNDNEKKLYEGKKIDILKLGLLDFQMANIIKKDDKYIVIDQEWTSKYDIPVKHMLFWAINILYSSIEELEKIISMDDLLKKYKISDCDIEIYKEISDFAFNDELNANNLIRMKRISCENNMFFASEYYDNKIDEMNQELMNCNMRVEELNSLNDELTNHNNELININNSIVNSKRWKIISKVCNIYDKFKIRN